MRLLSNITALFLISAFYITSILSAQNATESWTQWRGPNRDAKVQGAVWRDSLDDLQGVWRKDLGPSYSGPIVVGDQVFVTETKDKREEVVRSLHRATGEQQWEFSWKGAMKVPFFAQSNGSWIRSTPAYSDGKLYVAGMRDVLHCIDATNGQEIWSIDFVKQLDSNLPSFGLSSSPLIHKQQLYIQAGGGFTKIDAATGKVIWQTVKDAGGMSGGAFSSPIIATIAGVEQMVVQSRTELCGVNIADGKILWRRAIKAFRGMNILTPTVEGNTVFTSAYGGKALLFEISNKNGNFEVAERWSNKTQAYMSSPVAINGYIYLHLRNQRFTCIELSSGDVKWTTEGFGKYWSMVSEGDKILALDERGELLLIRANPEKFDLISRRKIAKEETWAHLAVLGDEVFVRELKAMTVLKWK